MEIGQRVRTSGDFAKSGKIVEISGERARVKWDIDIIRGERFPARSPKRTWFQKARLLAD